MKAIILAGGKGSRLLPLTTSIPKALVPINTKTLIESVIDALPDKVDTVIITTKYLGQLIEEKLGNVYGNKKILYAAQPVDQDGTWPAMYCAKKFIAEGEHFLLLNCDDLFRKEELEEIVANPKIGMGVTKRTMPAKYHGIVINDHGYVTDLYRHTDIPREDQLVDIFANGLFILDSNVFFLESVRLTDNEHGLPQTLLKHKDTYPLIAHHIAFWEPCNSLEDLEKLNNL